MNLNFPRLAEELGIPYTDGPRWIQIQCPFCGDSGEHLGYNIEREYMNCFRCGWHPLVETLAALAGISKWQAADTIERHRKDEHTRIFKKGKPARAPKSIDLPPLASLTSAHISYLKKRGFDEEEINSLIRTYGLYFTGPAGDFKLRVIIPIYHYQKLVAYQGRDITGQSKLRYKACPNELAVRPIKDCLYAADLAKNNFVAVVEGVFGAMRLGPGAVATFGTEFTWSQVRQLADRWEYRFIAFDNWKMSGGKLVPDLAGRAAGRKLCAALSALPGKTYNISIDATGPDDMTREQARKFWDMVLRIAHK